MLTSLPLSLGHLPRLRELWVRLKNQKRQADR